MHARAWSVRPSLPSLPIALRFKGTKQHAHGIFLVFILSLPTHTHTPLCAGSSAGIEIGIKRGCHRGEGLGRVGDEWRNDRVKSVY